MRVMRGPFPRSARAVAVAGLCALVLAGPSAARAGQATPAPAAAAGAISVAGAHLEQNGRPLVARGVQITGLVAPDDELSGKYIAAHDNFGAAELDRAAADHANVVRIQVSEFGLDPNDPQYEPGYLAEVENGVALARAAGLDVIISLQAEPPAGSQTRCQLPDAGAALDWQTLAVAFASDDDVMLELYNEPGLADNATDWTLWQYGGIATDTSGAICTTVGMQSLVDEIRATGARNVIILPGLDEETDLAGMPMVDDPSDPGNPQLAYAVHYPSLTAPSTTWSTEFGDLAARRPVIVTEWQANGTTDCVPDAPRMAPLLLSYLALKQIGVVGFAFDLPGTIIANYADTPTSYAGFYCGSFAGGAGQRLFDDYAGETAQATATDGTGVTQPWLLSAAELARISAQDAPGTAAALDTPVTFVLGARSRSLAALGLSAASPTESFHGETALLDAVSSGRVRPGTRAIELSLGSGAPAAQQRAAAQTFRTAAAVSHRYGYLFIAAPALGLDASFGTTVGAESPEAAFVHADLAGAVAVDADAVVLPFGAAQQDPAAYRRITRAAAAQAARAHPGVAVLGGLSIAPAPDTSARSPLSAARAVSSTVGGFALSGQPAPGDTDATRLLQGLYGKAG
jgi:hypothetical protein